MWVFMGISAISKFSDQHQRTTISDSVDEGNRADADFEKQEKNHQPLESTSGREAGCGLFQDRNGTTLSKFAIPASLEPVQLCNGGRQLIGVCETVAS
jgi:hypothetical protein